MATDLDRRCEAFGIALRYTDIWGHEHATPEATKRALLAAMDADAPVAPATLPAPVRCHALPAGTRVFGPVVQLYALRSRRNWGMGDFTDLATLAQFSAAHGAHFVGVNPLHEPFLDRPGDASPYSPSTRLAQNPLYLDVEAIEEFRTCDAARRLVASDPFAARLRGLRAARFVDYPGVWSAKRQVLRLLYEDFQRTPTFDDFAQREALQEAARFDAIQARAGAWGWPAWPEGTAPADDHEAGFFLYLQWQADLQLARAHDAARRAGMSIGLYRDLAVGANPGGAETWQSPSLFARDVHVGAPPDEFNRTGQDWGLPPWIPHRLRERGFAPWSELLRANMRHAGALRIDHVMAMARLYWIPGGMKPADGAYVRYPLADMAARLAQASAAARCLVVGEDLGTVSDELRATLRESGVLSYRVLYFERDADGAFKHPQTYPAQALVSISTHDLPTLRGFWAGTDLAHRVRLNLFPDDATRRQAHEARARDRAALSRAVFGETRETLTDDDVAAVHGYVARTPCALMALQLEDVFGETEQANLPATLDHQHPNWRRKVGIELEHWARDGRFARMCAAMRAEGR
jgi:(1->4)-alpha-D-glucan 1-alpha-D-glucosylmutase